MSDAAVIAEFNARMAWETEHRRLDPGRVKRGVTALLRDAAKGTYYLAEVNGAVAGQLLITHEWSDWRDGDFWWLQSVYVAEAFRRQGVFRALFEHVRRRAMARRDVCGLRLYLHAKNRRARRTYTRLGMSRSNYVVCEMDFVLKRVRGRVRVSNPRRPRVAARGN